MAVIDGIEADQRREQPPVRLGDAGTEEIAAARKPLLQPGEAVEQRGDGLLVGRLRGGETASVDAVVDGLVDAGVEGVDLLAQGFGIIVARPRPDAVEGVAQHADDLGRFVADDGLARLVPQHRHGHPPAVVGLCPAIELVEKAVAVEAVAGGTGAALEGPAAIAHVPVHHRHPDHVLEPLEAAEDEGAMGPGAGQRDVEMVAAGLGREPALAARAG